MRNIFKDDLKNEYADLKGITKTEALQRIDDILGLIADHLESGNNVKLANFFNFFVKELKEKPAVNPRTGEDMVIQATRTIVVKMTKPLKARIKK